MFFRAPRPDSFTPECELLARLLNRYLMRRFKYPLAPVRFGLSTDTQDCDRAAVRLYLRVIAAEAQYVPKGTIVISQIGFRK